MHVNIGIGTTAPSKRLHVADSTSGAEVAIFAGTGGGDPYITIGTASNAGGNISWDATNGWIELNEHGGGGIAVDAGGTSGTRTLAAATGNSLCYSTTALSGYNVFASCSSSIRYKENITPLTIDKSKVLQLQPVSFKWKDRDEWGVGLIAEEVEQLIPELVSYYDGKIEGVRYEQFTGYLLEILKEQESRLNALENALNANSRILDSKINAVKELSHQNAQLKTRILELDKRVWALERKM